MCVLCMRARVCVCMCVCVCVRARVCVLVLAGRRARVCEMLLQIRHDISINTVLNFLRLVCHCVMISDKPKKWIRIN